MRYEIIDTQAHIGPGNVDRTLAAMDAVGIRKLIIDECWLDNIMEWKPNVVLGDGILRHTHPTAQLAAAQYPDRFGYVLRVNRRDPEMVSVIRLAGDDPACAGIRITPGMDPGEWQAFATGAYDELLHNTQEAGLVMFIHMPDHPDWVDSCAKRHPDLTIVLDHCGLFTNPMRSVFRGLLPEKSKQEQEQFYFATLEKLSANTNLYLKWAHFSAMFEEPAFPASRRLSGILRKTIEIMGTDRILWASDFSVNQSEECWAELLYGILGDPGLSSSEKELILGGNAKRLLATP